MMKYIVIIGLLFPFGIAAQTISGKVTNNIKEPLVGANVYWQGTSVGVTTGVDGEFEIPLENLEPTIKHHSSRVAKKENTVQTNKELKVEIADEPKEEMVMVLIKPEERTSSYQIRPD